MLRLRTVYKRVSRHYVRREYEQDEFDIKSHFWKNKDEERKQFKNLIGFMNNGLDDFEFDPSKSEDYTGNLSSGQLNYVQQLQYYKYNSKNNRSKIIRFRTLGNARGIEKC